MKSDKKIEEIAKELNELIKRRAGSLNKNESAYKEAWTCLLQDLEHYHDSAKRAIQDYKEAALTVSSIEAEGYLRAWIQIRDIVERLNLELNDRLQ